jgi:hypothetical protein
MLNHDNCVVEGSDCVSAAGSCKTCLRSMVIADTCGVYVSVRIDLSAADEGYDTIVVM